MADDRKEMIQGLRDLADFIEQNEAAPVYGGLCLDVFVETPEELATITKRMGYVEKRGSGSFFYITKRFGPVRYEINIAREKVCIKKIVGTKTIPEHTEDVVEWECAESILATGQL